MGRWPPGLRGGSLCRSRQGIVQGGLAIPRIYAAVLPKRLRGIKSDIDMEKSSTLSQGMIASFLLE